MKLITIVVTRSKSCHVKTLHTILRLNVRTIQKGFANEIIYVNDDPYEKANAIQICMKKCDKLFFIDFGVGVDDDSLNHIFEMHDNVGCVVFPGVKEGINWDQFKSKLKTGSTEPVTQIGLEFDTEVGKKITENVYHVNKTDARAWIMNTKNVLKSLQKAKDTKIHPKMFEKFLQQGVRVFAFTAAKLTMTYTHECVSNILNAAGVKVN